MLRNADSISKNDTVITDPVMEPYFIVKSSSGGYVVYERVIKGDKKREYLNTICYPSSFNYALKVVAREKLYNKENRKYESIQEYIGQWKAIEESMKTMIQID